MRSHRPAYHRYQVGIGTRRMTHTDADAASQPSAVSWKSLSGDAVDMVLALLLTCETHDSASFRSTREDVVGLFNPDVSYAAWGAFDAAGVLVAFGIVRVINDGGAIDARCSGAVSPEWREKRLGSTIVEWQIEAARKLLSNVETHNEVRISRFCDESSAGERALLERMGFETHSSFTQMRRDLNVEIPFPEMAQHLRIEPWKDEWSEMIRSASDSPEALTAEGRRLSEDEWERMHANLVPEWSAVVVDRSSDRARLAGYVLAARWDDEWEALGWSEGYINALGIFSHWRKQRVGQRLLTHSMRAMLTSQMQFAGIDIASEGIDGLGELCEALGFEPTHRTLFYAINVESGPETS